jgi:hypothetical protein
VTSAPELPESIDAIMASIRASLAEDVVAPDRRAGPPPPSPPVPIPDSGITLEELVRSMLTPLLTAWLDAHLPEIVEVATHAEIRRLTGLADGGAAGAMRHG